MEEKEPLTQVQLLGELLFTWCPTCRWRGNARDPRLTTAKQGNPPEGPAQGRTEGACAARYRWDQ